MDFEAIWVQFDWVIAEMRDGMAFFEGWVPDINEATIPSALDELIDRAESHSFKYSTWSNDTTEDEWNRTYSTREYVEFFQTEKIVSLHFDYSFRTAGLLLTQKLIIEPRLEGMTVEIICYRDAILDSEDPKNAIVTALREFLYLKELFKGRALFIGPDTLRYPKIEEVSTEEWLRIG